MKNIEELKLEARISNLLIDFVRNFDINIDTDELQGMCEAEAMTIISIIKK